MNKRRFVADRRQSWRRFGELVDKIDENTQAKLSPEEAADFSRLFREVCYDLALIQSRDWGHGMVGYLNGLVTRGHNCFYSAPPGNLAYIVRFFTTGFPRVFRKNIGYFFAACALFFLPLGISWAVVQADPSLAQRVVDAQSLERMAEMYSEEGPMEKQKDNATGEFGEQRSAMAGFYVKNNVGIALQCFGRGILFGIGTAITLLYNGIVLGAISGYIISHGHGDRFLSFVISHGSFELTAIAVAGGAGLIMGDALVHPKERTRIESLRSRGGEAIQIACGAAVMLMIAALIEAFWSPSAAPSTLKYVIGTLLWVLVYLYLFVAGMGGPRTEAGEQRENAPHAL
jgi:uncharacterized membrane protein SpoIIM required for sporulation